MRHRVVIDSLPQTYDVIKEMDLDSDERRFREVRRRTRAMGVFSDRTSMERIFYAAFSYENLREGAATLFLR